MGNCKYSQAKMQHTIPQITQEDASKKSAFHPIEHEKYIPIGFLSSGCNKRDSGYSTDNSPATLSTHSRFTFDKDESIDEKKSATKSAVADVLSEELENITLDETNVSEVSESSIFSSDSMISDTDDDISMEDKEVKKLFQNRNVATIDPSAENAIRPNAPIPTPEEDYISNSRANSIFIPICSGMRMYTRPPATISRGTQTPSCHCQAIHEVLRDRSHPYMARGTAYKRLRPSSEGDDFQMFQEQGSLPDIIPHLLRRSLSLQVSIHTSQAEEIGRSLRRISDDFHDSYSRHSRRNRLNAGSFPGASSFDFSGWWERIRELLSPITFLSSPLSLRRPGSRVQRH